MPDRIPPPAARLPEDVPRLLSQAMSDGDLEAAVALYEPTAVLVLWDDSVAAGAAELAAALRRVLGTKLPLTREAGEVQRMGPMALLLGRWSMRGRSADLTHLELLGWQQSVVRRGRRGEWRYLVDHWAARAPRD